MEGLDTTGPSAESRLVAWIGREAAHCEQSRSGPVDGPDPVQEWRVLLELAQITTVLLEREIPQDLGLPPGGSSILRALRWGGPQSFSALTQLLNVSPETASHDVQAMEQAGWIQPAHPANPLDRDAIELTPEGVCLADRLVDEQQACVQRTFAALGEPHRLQVRAALQQLTEGLVAQSRSFSIVCAQCWAYSPEDCARPDAAACCPFLKTRRAVLDLS